MVKLLVFAILLASWPAHGLMDKLFHVEEICHKGCHSNYAAIPAHLDACKKGCDYKFLNSDCPNQCMQLSEDESIRSSCCVGCTLSRSDSDEVVAGKPVVVVDPVKENKDSGVAPPSNPEPEPERPRSIILIRLRQRPSVDMPSVQQFFNSDPIQFFNNIIKQFQENANEFDQAIRKSFEQNSKDFPKPPELEAIPQLIKSIPLIRVSGSIRADSSSESNEEGNDKRPLINEFKHVIHHPREGLQPINNRVQQFFTDVRTEWNDLVRKQPKIPIWIFLGILLSSSAILWYMVMSLCRHTPNRELSVRAQELVFHPYEHDIYEKEKIQPDDQPYEVTEPIKVKLSNI